MIVEILVLSLAGNGVIFRYNHLRRGDYSGRTNFQNGRLALCWCITISFADPGGILLISPGRNRWLVTAVIIFKQFKDVSTMIEQDLKMIWQKSRKRTWILKGRFSFSIECLLYPCCPTWQGTATPFGRQQHHAKKTNGSSFLVKRYAANNCCVVGFPADI